MLSADTIKELNHELEFITGIVSTGGRLQQLEKIGVDTNWLKEAYDRTRETTEVDGTTDSGELHLHEWLSGKTPFQV